MPIEHIRDAVPTKTAAKALGCDASRVRKLVNRGLLEGFKDGTATRVFVDSISAYQRRHTLVGGVPANEQRGDVVQVGGFRHAISRLQRRGLLKDFKL
jgi:hypothetical protein